MACFCSDKKKLDFDYVRKLAAAESQTTKQDIQIYFTYGYDGKTKYYDFESTAGGRKLQVVEVIQFSEPASVGVLSNIEQSEPEVIIEEVIKPIKSRTAKSVSKSVDTDSGGVL